MEERLQKILSRAGIASRRGAEQVMSEGRVTVNGETVRLLGTKADITTDDIRVDGVRVKPPQENVYILLNKPKGVVSTRHDPEGRTTVMQLVPPVVGLFPVGRLDLATEGLILLTNDGAFAQQVSHPRYEVARTYEAKVRDIPDAETLEKLRKGVKVDGDLLKVDHVRIVEAENNAWLEITLHEGKNHEVRRMLDAVGHPVSKLRRVALGPLTLKGMKPGEFRPLLPQEIRALLRPQPKARPVTAGASALGGLRKGPRRRPVVHPRPPEPRTSPAGDAAAGAGREAERGTSRPGAARGAAVKRGPSTGRSGRPPFRKAAGEDAERGRTRSVGGADGDVARGRTGSNEHGTGSTARRSTGGAGRTSGGGTGSAARTARGGSTGGASRTWGRDSAGGAGRTGRDSEGGAGRTAGRGRGFGGRGTGGRGGTGGRDR